jgi:hypothetical protein
MTTLLCIIFNSCSFDTRLETWADPTPRESEFTVHNLREACIKACRRGTILQAARSLVRPSEEQLRQREEQDRKFDDSTGSLYQEIQNAGHIHINQ